MVILSMTLRVTLTVVDASRVPPSPLAVMVYCVVSFGQTLRDPLVSTLPSPWLIEALEAFDVDQDRVAHCPCFTDPGSAEIDTIGAGAAGGGGGAGAGAGAALATGFFGHKALIIAMARLALAI